MPTLEFSLDPANAATLPRLPAISRVGRTTPLTFELLDTTEATLRNQGAILVATPRQARLERLHAETPVSPPTRLAEARTISALPDLSSTLTVITRLQATTRRLRWSGPEGTVDIHLLEARLPRHRTPLCRLTLDGDPPALEAATQALAHQAGLAVPRATLPAELLARQSKHPLPPRALGAPQIPANTQLSDAIARIMTHLLDVMLHWAHHIPTATSPEPVHQMRVATRRLRAALSTFKSAAPCPHLATPTRLCATHLGAARDWDVFLGGTGAQLADAFPGDPRCTALLRTATRRRRTAYATLRDYLASPDFHGLTASLALAATLRPWDATEPAGPLSQDTALFAADALGRHHKRVHKAGRGLAHLTVPALHELRKDCKRLRYTAEFFAPLFPGKTTSRYLKRLALLQEELGLLNDTAAIAGLTAQLGRAERGYAAGLVEGFAAARATPGRQRIAAAWRRLKAADAFWSR